MGAGRATGDAIVSLGPWDKALRTGGREDGNVDLQLRECLADDRAERLDRVLAGAWPDLSRSRLQALIRDGRVKVAGAAVRDPSWRPPAGAAILLDEPPSVPAAPAAEPIPLAIVHEDDQIVVIDKPAGLVVHPGAGHANGTLVNALLAHCGASLSGIGGVKRPGIVHRLDKDTSGLLVVAKTDHAHRGLSEQFADHGRTGPLRRAYLAFVWGVPEPRRGLVEAPLARAATSRDRIAVTSPGAGRHALTRYAVEERFPAGGPEPAVARLRCELETGRTHQIRVHLAHLRHPLLGDAVYGSGFRTKASRLSEAARAALAALGRQALHAATLRFVHPTSGEVMSFDSALPPDLARLQQALRSP